VVLVPHCFVHPSVFDPITEELARDHRVIRYNARGTGESTRRGPYDMETGAGDLAALIEEAGGPAVAISIGDATNRAVRAAAARPDLLQAVVGQPPISATALDGTDAMASSRTVLDAMVEMMETDYRGAVRSIVTTGNPQMSEDELRERVREQVEYCPQEASVSLFRAWIDDDATPWARDIGGRLWAIYSDEMGGPWFPEARQLTAIIREHLPEAHTNELEDGIVSRPDLAAGIVRGITAPADVESAR
jgi:pimeloyl-ACP methyl ester carboxylesterase